MPMRPEEKESEALRLQLEQICGSGNASTASQDLFCYSRDMWPRSLIMQRAGRLEHLPRAVVWPRNREEICRLVLFAKQRRLCLIPFGAGSGVCAGTLPVAGEIVVDLKRLDDLLVLDGESGLVEVGAGMVGEVFERRLNRMGFTCGHFPSSMQCSTVGGWVAARGAGQCSSRYGKIEDMVRGLTLVDGEGVARELFWKGTGSWSALPLVVGSEGTFGVITSLKMLVRPLAPKRWLRGFTFPGVEAGLAAMQKIMQRGLRPAVLRLYDEFDSLMALRGGKQMDEESLVKPLLERIAGPAKKLFSFSIPHLLANARWLNQALRLLPAGCLMVVVVEGDDEECATSGREITRICLGQGAEDRGPSAAEHWLAHRYDISYRQSAIFSAGAFVDTMEVATTWDRLLSLYNQVRQVVGRRAFVMAHFSHAYREGCSVYFTFAGAASDDARSAALYDRLWDEAQEVVFAHRATVSHHHGVGWSKRYHLSRQLGEGKALLEEVKAVFDPGCIFNPEKLGVGKLPGRQAQEGKESKNPDRFFQGRTEPIAVRIVQGVYQPGDAGEMSDLVRRLFYQHKQLLLFGSGRRIDISALGRQLDDCALISTRRLNSVDEVNRRGAYLVAGAGARLEDLRELCRQNGLSLAEESDGTLGGWLARSGTLYEPVIGVDVPAALALEVVLPDGRRVNTVPVPRSATGPDLNALWLGSHGFLGVIVRAWLKLEPLAEAVSEQLAEFSATGPALELLSQLRRGFFPPRRLVAELERVEGNIKVVLAARFTGERGLVNKAVELFQRQVASQGGRLAESAFHWPGMQEGGCWIAWKELPKLMADGGWSKIRLFGVRPDGCLVADGAKRPMLGDLDLFREIKKRLDPEFLFNRPLWRLAGGQS